MLIITRVFRGFNTTMRLKWMLVLAALGGPATAVCATSWGSPYTSYVAGGFWWTAFSWGIDLDGPPDLTPINCGANECIVVVATRSGVKPLWPGTCDNGGTCNGVAVQNPVNTNKWVKVPSSASWDFAYRTFVAKYGTAGESEQQTLQATRIPPADHPTWGSLCVGFIALRPSGYTSPAFLAPSTTCGLVNPPDLKCDIGLDDAYDFGVINTGPNDARTARGGMRIQCTSDATVTVALTRTHTIAGVPLHMEINGREMSIARQNVFVGREGNLPVNFRLVGVVKEAGQFVESVPVIVSYY